MNYEKFVLGKKYRPTLSTRCYTCVGFRTDGVPILEGGAARSLIVPSDPHNWAEVHEPRECWALYSGDIQVRCSSKKEHIKNFSNWEAYEIVHMREVQDA